MRKTIAAFLLFSCILSFIAGCTNYSNFSQNTNPVNLPARTMSPAVTGDIRQKTATPVVTLTSMPSPSPTTAPTSTQTSTIAPTPTPAILIGAGDIAYCGNAPEDQGDEHTAAVIQNLLKQSPDATIMTVGDTAYGDGTLAELKNCFGPTWGQFKDHIRPAPGNHDYMTDNGAPYYEYFGAAAGPAGLGYYSYNLGDWHIVVLNSNCDQIACTLDSQQVKWLRTDLQQNKNECTLSYWHHPRWSSGLAGGGSSATFWKTVAELGVDVVVNGHDHDYERFAPMDANGAADPLGTREFVVGTGGAELRKWGKIKPNSEVRINNTHGVIEFKFYPGYYQWNFIPAEDSTMTDMGTGTCH